ncbi:High-affinity glucose transporter rgt2 [Entophlyctis luteolus]|nr:High-affinity glucose transporter rgt2 [Entophlyctis luteolus]
MGAVKSYYNILVAFTAAVGAFCFGWEIGVIGQVLGMPAFQAAYGTDTNTTSWIASVFQFGCAASAFCFGYLADIIGRKYSIVFAGTTFAIGGALQAGSQSLGMLITGRVISGIAIGAASTCVPLYLAETAPADIRGAITTIYHLMITIGILVAGIINAIIISSPLQTNDDGWRLALGLQVVPAVVLVILMFAIPFSPRWLCQKGRHDEGLATIAKLRGLPVSDSAVIEEYALIREGFEFESSLGEASWGEVLSGSNGKRVFIGVINQALQQLTGINVITYFQPQLYKIMGFGDVLANQVLPVVFDFANFIFTFIGMFGVDKYGRKTLLAVGGVVMSIGLALTYGFAKAVSNGAASGIAVIAYIGIIVFDLGFSSTWGPVVWSYQAEIFPMRVRAKGVALSTMSNWLVGAIITWAEPHLVSALNLDVYTIYLSFCIIGVPWAFFCVPETRGKTLEELGEVFGDKVAHHSEGLTDVKTKSP